jgi:ankyrin repeat protein
MGDLHAVRRCFLDHKIANLDLDSALDAAAAYAHLSIVELLIAFGATDLDSALLSAAARDHAKIVAYLISEERLHPATNTKDAQTLAANVGAINADWLLTAHRWDELRS